MAMVGAGAGLAIGLDMLSTAALDSMNDSSVVSVGGGAGALAIGPCRCAAAFDGSVGGGDGALAIGPCRCAAVFDGSVGAGMVGGNIQKGRGVGGDEGSGGAGGGKGSGSINIG